MYVGAVRGYLSDAHRKVVFSKVLQAYLRFEAFKLEDACKHLSCLCLTGQGLSSCEHVGKQDTGLGVTHESNSKLWALAYQGRVQKGCVRNARAGFACCACGLRRALKTGGILDLLGIGVEHIAMLSTAGSSQLFVFAAGFKLSATVNCSQRRWST